jgi:hypothetical protein
MKRFEKICLAVFFVVLGLGAAPRAAAQTKKPNIVVIMTDDVGIWNISAYHRGHDGWIVSQFLGTFKEYPPSQASGGLTVTQFLEGCLEESLRRG